MPAAGVISTIYRFDEITITLLFVLEFIPTDYQNIILPNDHR